MNPIIFPNLNLEFNISQIAFTVCGRPIYWYGLIILSGILISLFLGHKKVKRLQTEKKIIDFNWDTILDLVIVMLPVGIICARLYYCIFHGDYYFQHPLDIIKIWNRRSCYIWWYNWGSCFWFYFLQGEEN